MNQKTIIAILITVIIALGGVVGYLTLNKSQQLAPAEKYCLARGGKIYVDRREGREEKMCLINNGQDGITCKIDDFFVGKCGSAFEETYRKLNNNKTDQIKHKIPENKGIKFDSKTMESNSKNDK